MIKYLRQWYQKKFDSNEPAVFIVVTFIAVLIINFFGGLLAPILAGVVIAYLLEAVVSLLSRRLKVNRSIAVYLVFLAFISVVIAILLFVLPALMHQAGQFLQSIPEQINNLHASLLKLSQKYPNIITSEQIKEGISAISNIKFDKIAGISQYLIKFSLVSLSSIFAWLVYLFIVPLLAFFFLKDKERIARWFVNMLPNERGALEEVWADVRPQLGNYVKGKTIECLIVTLATYIGFIMFGLNYALLLAILVGLSVFIPYIGMVIVTIPIVLIGLSQFGFTSQFFYMLLVYLIIQGLDGNLLVPLLFSEALSLHPVAVIASVLVFGGIWGFWGLFFAIPLAALINSGVKMWTRRNINNRKPKEA
ncbi:AI-2E family transporter [Fastidiosibacter lacustris]|uniref:AI-2E family transporter n=1 Tax=Fastidiosibacter lacustris TaxID=2056695 RepID=UPI000E344F26|nr:AI-2E family transporter [Fastidiosibacter lacustris]